MKSISAAGRGSQFKWNGITCMSPVGTETNQGLAHSRNNFIQGTISWVTSPHSHLDYLNYFRTWLGGLFQLFKNTPVVLTKALWYFFRVAGNDREPLQIDGGNTDIGSTKPKWPPSVTDFLPQICGVTSSTVSLSWPWWTLKPLLVLHSNHYATHTKKWLFSSELFDTSQDSEEKPWQCNNFRKSTVCISCEPISLKTMKLNLRYK